MQSLAVLLLDFEKAYDRVDSDFLRALLLDLAYPQDGSEASEVFIGQLLVQLLSEVFWADTSCWAVLFGRVVQYLRTCFYSLRRLFWLSFADCPCLCRTFDFLYLQGTRRSCLIWSMQMILLFMYFFDGTPDCVRGLIDRFCLASGARVNLYKSLDILIGTD